jgi:RNA polymerase sigma-70 factor (ECF subfamily)
MIQILDRHVKVVMYALAPCSPQSSALLENPAFRRSNRPEAVLWRRRPMISPDRQRASDSKYWVSLIEAVAMHEDRAAFAALFEHFAPLVKTFMRRSGVTEASADELAQETLLLVWRKASLFDPSTTGAAAWIFTIARNIRIDAHRRRLRGGVTEISDVDSEFRVDESPGPESRVAAAQAENRVRTALAALSEEQRRVLELSFYEEKAHGEIARILRIPLGTVKSRARLAMNRLRNLLDEFS